MIKTIAGGVECENKKCEEYDSAYIANCGKYGAVKQNLPYETITKKVKQCEKSK